MPATEQGDALTNATKRIGLIGAMLTIVLGINTLVSSCNSQKSEHEASVRSVISAEEDYWNAAARELGDIAQLKASQDSAGWSLRFKLLRDRVINHPKLDTSAADFDDRQREAMRSVNAMRLSVETALGDPALYGEAAAVAQQAIDTRDQNLANVANQPNLTAPQREVAQAAAGAIATRARNIDLTPQSPDGWDVDVFWCERADEAGAAANFAVALAAGRVMADTARSSTARVGGQKIGRVRVRALSLTLQQSTSVDYPDSGLWLRYDDTPTERPFAAALGQLPIFAGFRGEATEGYTSPWYVSAYACAN